MKVTVPTTKEINVTHVLIEVPVNYGDEEIPFDFPLRNVHDLNNNDMWRARVNIDTGKIEGWPANAGARDLYLTVKDSGTYTLLGSDPNSECVLQLAKRDDYVPNSIIPGNGDTIELKIAADGTITNWLRPSEEGVARFFFRDDTD